MTSEEAIMNEPLPNRLPYPQQREHIAAYMEKLAENQPAVMGGFATMHEAGGTDTALSGKMKELIALAIAVTARCDGCIAFHTHDVLQSGATREEIMDALGVAVLMGGGPSVVYATHVIDAMEQFGG
jgi:AhpD family alkylhydroperoxidase